MAIRKEGALKFRIRPKGGTYHHMLSMLERLGRGEGSIKVPSANALTRSTPDLDLKRKAKSEASPPPLCKRPRRSRRQTKEMCYSK